WGLRLSLIVCIHTARAEEFKTFGIAPAPVCTALLVYGLWQLGSFQQQERVWRSALDRARMLSLINFGLSPFLFWWNRVPGNFFFVALVALVMTMALIWKTKEVILDIVLTAQRS